MTDPDTPGSAEATSDLRREVDTEVLPTAPAHWVTAAGAAGVAWLAALCVGAVCLLALKLQFPALARDSDPIEILTGVVIASLGLLRVPIHIGGLTVSALPLGAVLAIGVAIGWAVSGTARLRATSAQAAAGVGARVASVFALVGLVLALVFRVRSSDPIAADAPWALVLGFVWALPFATAGALLRPRRWVSVATRHLVAPAGHLAAEGLRAGAVMVVSAGVLALAALLVWVIVGLATAPDPAFAAREMAAAAIYLLAFLPNVVTALVALSVGAPILQGAQVGVRGDVVGGLHEISLLHWPDVPAVAYGLLLIPVLACGAGGWWIARRVSARTDAWRSILLAGGTFAVTFAVLAWVGEARVGAGLLEKRGVARMSVLPLPTLGWGMLWASVFGWLGWELGLRKGR